MPTPGKSARTLTLLAPAKINLHLRVGPRRADGFHPLLTWMATIGLFDILTLNDKSQDSRAYPADAPVILSCDDPTLAVDGTNLVHKAATEFLRKSGDSQHAAAIHLQKRIPAGGGLGGGSSDAASALVGLNDLWNAGQNVRWLSDLGAVLGSDVPFFLYGPSSICQGRGEAVRPIGVRASRLWVTLVLPPIGMPTAAVYRRFDELGLGNGKDVEQEPDWSEWASINAHSLLPRLVNDLETPAFSLRSDLGELRRHIEKTVHRPVRMSGSGSSLFTLFDTESEAMNAAEKITAEHHVQSLAVQLMPENK